MQVEYKVDLSVLCKTQNKIFFRHYGIFFQTTFFFSRMVEVYKNKVSSAIPLIKKNQNFF